MKLMKKHFNNNLIISEEEEEEEFQSSSTCWISEKLIDDEYEKVRDHCHVTGKFTGAAHWICNINLQLTKNVPMIFHNVRGYDSHLVFCELWCENWRNTKQVRIINFFKQKLSLYWQYVIYEV